MSDVMILTTATFDATIKEGVTLVDFWATWCGPCQMQGPILEKQVAPNVPAAKICKVSVETDKDLAVRFGVQSIPALLIFKDGELKQQFTGLTRGDVLVQAIQALL